MYINILYEIIRYKCGLSKKENVYIHTYIQILEKKCINSSSPRESKMINV